MSVACWFLCIVLHVCCVFFFEYQIQFERALSDNFWLKFHCKALIPLFIFDVVAVVIGIRVVCRSPTQPRYALCNSFLLSHNFSFCSFLLKSFWLEVRYFFVVVVVAAFARPHSCFIYSFLPFYHFIRVSQTQFSLFYCFIIVFLFVHTFCSLNMKYLMNSCVRVFSTDPLTTANKIH